MPKMVQNGAEMVQFSHGVGFSTGAGRDGRSLRGPSFRRSFGLRCLKRRGGRGGRAGIHLRQGFGGRGGAKVAELAANQGVDLEEPFGTDELETAAGQLGLKLFLDFGQAGDLGFVGNEQSFVEGFELDGPEGGDFRLALAVPVHEGAFANAEF